MAQNPLIKRYLDAGIAFTQMTQARAEAIVKDLVKAGEVQAAKTEELVNQILERSRKNTDRLLEIVRKEVRDQVASLGLATKDDIARLEKQIAGRSTGTKRAAKSTKAAKKATKKAVARKAATKKSARKTGGGAKRAAKKSAGS